MRKFIINKRLPFSNFWQIILLSCIGTVIWRIFYPGLMSNDSNDQYLQAALGCFMDWHPPLMSIILSGFLKLGGPLRGLAALILVQCFLAIFGLRSLIIYSLLFFSSNTIKQSHCRIAATLITILFLIPFFTPFMFFSVIFWKDSWLAIILLWMISHLLWLFLSIENLSNKKFWMQLLLLSIYSVAVILVRHNAITILPSLGLIITMLGKIKFGNIGLISAGFLLLLTFTVNPIITFIFDVKHNDASSLVFGNDFAKMLRIYPELKPEYPLAARSELLPAVSHKHVFIYWGLDVTHENTELKKEYQQALTTHPFKLLYTRFYLFEQMLDSSSWYLNKVHYGIEINDFGLKINQEFADTRTKLSDLSEVTGDRWYFIWLSGLHIIWLALNFIFVIYYLIKFLRHKKKKTGFLILIYLIPLSYYSSYILAAVSPDYRYMYPSTIIIQCLCVSLIAAKIWRRLQKQKMPSDDLAIR